MRAGAVQCGGDEAGPRGVLHHPRGSLPQEEPWPHPHPPRHRQVRFLICISSLCLIYFCHLLSFNLKWFQSFVLWICSYYVTVAGLIERPAKLYLNDIK